jgi:hypothetical protein
VGKGVSVGVGVDVGSMVSVGVGTGVEVREDATFVSVGDGILSKERPPQAAARNNIKNELAVNITFIRIPRRKKFANILTPEG